MGPMRWLLKLRPVGEESGRNAGGRRLAGGVPGVGVGGTSGNGVRRVGHPPHTATAPGGETWELRRVQFASLRPSRSRRRMAPTRMSTIPPVASTPLPGSGITAVDSNSKVKVPDCP